MANSQPDVRISDLADPQLAPELRDYMAQQVSESSVSFSREAILRDASAQSGLDDFGADDFHEALDVYCAALSEDADLSDFGRLTTYNMMVRYAVQRLRFEREWREHPQVAEERVERPIIIVGLPRSGTTHLLNLIAGDPTLRSLRYWESLEPVPSPGESDEARRERCREQLVAQDLIMPYFKNMHEMHADHIHEEIELGGMAFSTMLFENFAFVPRWRDYYLRTDQTRAYRYIRNVLKLLQWYRGPRRWVLKSPAHMEQYPLLAKLYPDATFVVTHRDPVPMVASLVTMLSYSARMSRDPVKPREIGAYWVDRVERMLAACVRDHAALPAERTVDVMFDDFMANDVAMVEKIYRTADHPFDDATRAAMDAYMAAHPRGKFGRVIYDLKGDFGIDVGELRERYAFYTDHFGIASGGR